MIWPKRLPNACLRALSWVWTIMGNYSVCKGHSLCGGDEVKPKFVSFFADWRISPSSWTWCSACLTCSPTAWRQHLCTRRSRTEPSIDFFYFFDWSVGECELFCCQKKKDSIFFNWKIASAPATHKDFQFFNFLSSVIEAKFLTFLFP